MPTPDASRVRNAPATLRATRVNERELAQSAKRRSATTRDAASAITRGDHAKC